MKLPGPRKILRTFPAWTSILGLSAYVSVKIALLTGLLTFLLLLLTYYNGFLEGEASADERGNPLP